MVTKSRRTLKQAYKDNSSPELANFVFGSDSTITPQTPELEPEPEAEVVESGTEIVVSIAKIHKTFSFTPNGKPVRYYYDQSELMEWAETDIKPNGLRTALWTRPMPGKPGEYELVAGLRRLTACELIGMSQIPIKVFDWNDNEAYAAAFDENDRRRDFSKLEELDITLNILARQLNAEREEIISLLYRMDNQAKGKTTQNVLGNGSAAVIEEFFKARGQLTWQSFVSTRLPLLRKPPEILDAIRSSRIDYTKAVEIARLKSAEDRKAMLETAIKQRLSVNEVKQRVKSMLQTSQPTPVNDLKARFRVTVRQLERSNIWADAEKASKLQKYLEQIEQLVN